MYMYLNLYNTVHVSTSDLVLLQVYVLSVIVVYVVMCICVWIMPTLVVLIMGGV